MAETCHVRSVRRRTNATRRVSTDGCAALGARLVRRAVAVASARVLSESTVTTTAAAATTTHSKIHRFRFIFGTDPTFYPEWAGWDRTSAVARITRSSRNQRGSAGLLAAFGRQPRFLFPDVEDFAHKGLRGPGRAKNERAVLRGHKARLARNAGAAESAVAAQVPGEVLLVIRLGVVERRRGRDFRRDLAVPRLAQAALIRVA